MHHLPWPERRRRRYSPLTDQRRRGWSQTQSSRWGSLHNSIINIIFLGEKTQWSSAMILSWGYSLDTHYFFLLQNVWYCILTSQCHFACSSTVFVYEAVIMIASTGTGNSWLSRITEEILCLGSFLFHTEALYLEELASLKPALFNRLKK